MYKKYLILAFIVNSCVVHADDQINQQQTRDYLSQKQQIDQLAQTAAPFIQLQQAAVKHAYPWLAPEPVCFGISSIEIETPISHPELQAADFYQALKVLKYSDNKVLGRCIGDHLGDFGKTLL